MFKKWRKIKEEKKYLISDSIILLLCIWSLTFYPNGEIQYILFFCLGYILCIWLGSLDKFFKSIKKVKKRDFLKI